MSATSNYLAYDLGASSGRAVVGKFDGNRVALEEIHRFTNTGIPVGENLYWDALRLFEEMREGLRKSIALHSSDFMGIGIDTWGVDFALLDEQDELLGNPRCYRDPRVNGMMEEAFRTVSREEIFNQTGIQFMGFNTLYQLLAMTRENSPQLKMAKTFLTMPDLFNFWLTGQKVCECSIASTTQFYNPREENWATGMLQQLNIPTHILPEIVPPGTSLGPISSTLATELGIKPVEVIAPACHDTGSAVAAVPMSDPNAIYISCGTWALMGTEIDEPAITPQSLAYNFTNEGGVCGTFRFLKNIAGLWLVQESKRIWELGGSSFTWDDLTALATASKPLTAFVDPDHADFAVPGDMPGRIREFCTRTRQSTPQSEGEIIRCALESIALKCRFVLEQLEDVLDRKTTKIHIVGGGIQNTLLCNLIANATGCQVLAGPIEATALGNILVQAMARNQLGSLSEVRDIVRISTEITTYEPENRDAWEDAFGRFKEILEV